MKTIKIIDLLNKIANGEELPEQIKYKKHEYDLVNRQYLEDDLSGLDLIYLDELNDEVEIIEEDKKIEKIKNNCEYDENLTYEEVRRHMIHNINFLKDKINELIDKVNSLENK